MGWLIFLGLLVLLNCLPFGGRVCFDGQTFQASVLIGRLPIQLYPMPDWLRKRGHKPKPEKPKKAASEEKKEPQKKDGPAQADGGWRRFLPLVRTGLDFLGSLRRKLRLNNLTLIVTLAGDDPADLAQNYGRAWAALGNLMPLLERAFVIKKREMDVRCDFCGEQTKVYFAMDLTITLGRILSLLAVYGVRILRQFLTMKKAVAKNE